MRGKGKNWQGQPVPEHVKLSDEDQQAEVGAATQLYSEQQSFVIG